MKQASVDVFSVAWGLVFGDLHLLSLPLTPSGSSSALTGGKVRVSHPVIPQPWASVTQIETCADCPAWCLRTAAVTYLPAVQLHLEGSWCSRVPVFFRMLRGRRWIKSGCWQFYILGQFLASREKRYHRSLPSRTHHCPLVSSRRPCGSCPGSAAAAPTASTRRRLAGREAREGVCGRASCGYCSGLALPQLAEHVPPAPPRDSRQPGQNQTAFYSTAITLGG